MQSFYLRLLFLHKASVTSPNVVSHADKHPYSHMHTHLHTHSDSPQAEDPSIPLPLDVKGEYKASPVMQYIQHFSSVHAFSY